MEPDLDLVRQITELRVRCDENERRLEELSNQITALNSIATAVEVLATRVETVRETVEKTQTAVEELKKKPEHTLDNIIKTVITVTVTAFITWLISGRS